VEEMKGGGGIEMRLSMEHGMQGRHGAHNPWG
jgi:hypothetical protein